MSRDKSRDGYSKISISEERHSEIFGKGKKVEASTEPDNTPALATPDEMEIHSIDPNEFDEVKLRLIITARVLLGCEIDEETIHERLLDNWQEIKDKDLI